MQIQRCRRGNSRLNPLKISLSRENSSLFSLNSLANIPIGIHFSSKRAACARRNLFGRWNDVRAKGYEKQRIFKKAHITSGVKTNIITAIEATPGQFADSKQFPGLIKKIVEDSRIEKVNELKNKVKRVQQKIKLKEKLKEKIKLAKEELQNSLLGKKNPGRPKSTGILTTN